MPRTGKKRDLKREIERSRERRARGIGPRFKWQCEPDLSETAEERHEREQSAWLRSQQI